MMHHRLTARAIASTRGTAAAVASLGGTLLPAVALASGGQCAPDEFCFAIQGYYIINFVVFVAILFFAGKKTLADGLQKRYEEVAKEIESAQAAKAAAEEKYEAYRRRVERLEEENATLLAEVRAGTETEVQQILAEARAASEHLQAEVSLRVSQENKRLREALHREASELSLSLARQLLTDRLSGDAGQAKQQALLVEGIDLIEELPGPGTTAFLSLEKELELRAQL